MSEQKADLIVLRAPWYKRLLNAWSLRIEGCSDGTPLVSVRPRYWHPWYWIQLLRSLCGKGPDFIELPADQELTQ